MTKNLKISVEKYGKIWRFSIKKFCGYICCDRLKRVSGISHEALEYDDRKIKTYICSCGHWTDEDKWFHKVVINGSEEKYE